MSSKIYMAAYGMNTNCSEMSFRCPDATIVGIGTLHNYELKFRLHADIECNPGKSMHVLVWEISQEDLQALDMLEGYPSYYTRFTVPVFVCGSIVEAVIYQMTDNTFESPPQETYLHLCSNGYQTNNMNIAQLEDAYFSSLVNYKMSSQIVS